MEGEGEGEEGEGGREEEGEYDVFATKKTVCFPRVLDGNRCTFLCRHNAESHG